MKNTSRRDFIKSSSAIGSFFILPSGLLAKAPNSKICTAHIGTGGKGRIDTMYLAKHSNVEVIGLCDVDYAHGKIDTWSKQFKNATAFQDYREMLAKLDDKIDVVSIPLPIIHTTRPPWMRWKEVNTFICKNPLRINSRKPDSWQNLPRKKD